MYTKAKLLMSFLFMFRTTPVSMEVIRRLLIINVYFPYIIITQNNHNKQCTTEVSLITIITITKVSTLYNNAAEKELHPAQKHKITSPVRPT